jgi:type IV secretion system protein VirB11
MLRNSLGVKRNILVSGGTGSGKTTFVNALIRELAELCPHDRLGIAEDTPELQSASPNSVCLLSTAFLSLNEIVKGLLRFRPDRILVGEVRDGSALELLKAWNTGHPGGIGTLHADSAEETLPRLEELVAEATSAPKQALIGRAVDRVVSIAKRPEGRRITELLDVVGWDALHQRYNTASLWRYAT